MDGDGELLLLLRCTALTAEVRNGANPESVDRKEWQRVAVMVIDDDHGN